MDLNAYNENLTSHSPRNSFCFDCLMDNKICVNCKRFSGEESVEDQLESFAKNLFENISSGLTTSSIPTSADPIEFPEEYVTNEDFTLKPLAGENSEEVFGKETSQHGNLVNQSLTSYPSFLPCITFENGTGFQDKNKVKINVTFVPLNKPLENNKDPAVPSLNDMMKVVKGTMVQETFSDSTKENNNINAEDKSAKFETLNPLPFPRPDFKVRPRQNSKNNSKTFKDYKISTFDPQSLQAGNEQIPESPSAHLFPLMGKEEREKALRFHVTRKFSKVVQALRFYPPHAFKNWPQFQRHRVSPALANSKESCSLCSYPFGLDGVEMAVIPMPCGCILHEICLWQWLQVSSSCPTCEIEIVEAGNVAQKAISGRKRDSTGSIVFVRKGSLNKK